MLKKISLILFGIVLAGGVFLASGLAKEKEDKPRKDNRVVHVYGPGGPLGPMEELAERFSTEQGLRVQVVAGPEGKWIDQAKRDGDIIYGGSSYMLRNFAFSYPELLQEESWIELYTRPAGILVRKGNPKQIESLADLTDEGIRIVDVNGAGQLGLWEDLAGRKGLIPGIRKNMEQSVKTSAEAIKLWESDPDIDAWITYESWHYRLQDTTDLVTLPDEDQLFRGTPVAMTNNGSKKKAAEKFMTYLQTDEAHQVFQKWGWK